MNNSSNTFTLTSDLELSPSSFINRILTLAGSGDFNLNCWTNWSSTIVKNGTGTLSLSGGFDNVGLSVIANAGTMLLDKASVTTPGLGVEVHAIGSALTIAGAMVQVAGTGDDQIYHSATVDVQSGTFDTNGRFESFRILKLSGAGIGGAGALVNNAAGTTATLEVRNGSMALTGNTTVGGPGNLVVSTVGSSSVGNYDLTKIGAGSVTFPNGQYKNVLVSAGTLDIRGSTFAATSGTVTIDAGARFRTGNMTTARVFNVDGTLEIVAGQNLQLTGGQLNNNGQVTGSVTINNGAIATGAGAFDVVTVRDGGTFAPGNSPGIATANSMLFDNTTTTNGGPTLSIEIAGTDPGTQHDQLHVAGHLSLAGTLDVSLITGFNPSAGDWFDVLDFGSVSGAFNTISFPALGTGIMWNAAQLYTSGTLTVNIAGDYNSDDAVDAADYVVWRKGLGMIYTQDDFNTWCANFGETLGGGSDTSSTNVPEPAALCLIIIAAIVYECRPRLRLRG